MKKGKVTITDVAKAAGVSAATASHIISNPKRRKIYNLKTQLRVDQACEALGYVPSIAAQRLRSGRTNLWGLLLTRTLEDSAYAMMLQEAESQIRNLGKRVLLSVVPDGPDEEEKRVRQMLEERVEGLIVGPLYGPADRVAWCRRIPVPIVLFGGISDSTLNEVAFDHVQSFDLAAGYLKQMGHRRVGALRCKSQTIEPLIKHGIAADDKWMIQSRTGSWDMQELFTFMMDFVTQWKQARAQDRPTAVLCRDDYTARFAMAAMLRQGVDVPNDLSVMGLGNISESAYYPVALTTVDQKARQRIQLAGQRLQELLENLDQPAKVQILEPQLVVRQSVANLS